jgi:hypothetical protein
MLKERTTIAVLNGDSPSDLTEGVSNLWELLVGLFGASGVTDR